MFVLVSWHLLSRLLHCVHILPSDFLHLKTGYVHGSYKYGETWDNPTTNGE